LRRSRLRRVRPKIQTKRLRLPGHHPILLPQTLAPATTRKRQDKGAAGAGCAGGNFRVVAARLQVRKIAKTASRHRAALRLTPEVWVAGDKLWARVAAASSK